jgi:hypothetical protein
MTKIGGDHLLPIQHFLKTSFDTDPTHRATIKLATIADLNTNFS